MVSGAGFSETHGVGLALRHVRQEEEGQPIIIPAMWLVPGALVGAAVLMLLAMVRKR
jgi:hypothetical protein